MCGAPTHFRFVTESGHFAPTSVVKILQVVLRLLAIHFSRDGTGGRSAATRGTVIGSCCHGAAKPPSPRSSINLTTDLNGGVGRIEFATAPLRME
jgi:hypothetical protein